MNLYQERMMDKPSIGGSRCAFCGRRAQSRHHIVPRSQGGAKGPTVPVCGFGNESGCHGLLHAHRLHIDWREGWAYLYTPKPMKFDVALTYEGWKTLGELR